jgi:hypothetical protein
MLVAHAWQNDQFGQFFSERFIAAETKNPLGGGIKFENQTAGVDGDDAIEGGIEDTAIEHLQLIVWIDAAFFDARF